MDPFVPMDWEEWIGPRASISIPCFHAEQDLLVAFLLAGWRPPDPERGGYGEEGFGGREVCV